MTRRSRNNGRYGGRRAAAICIAIALFAVAAQGCRKDEGGKARQRSVPVTTAAAGTADVPVIIRTIGKVEAFSTVTMRARVNGELTGVFFAEGQDVRKGDNLFSIDSRPFEAEVRHAEARLLRDTAELKHAETELDRHEKLFQEGFVTKQQLDRARTTVDALNAVIKADRADLENAKIRLGYCTIVSPIDGRTGARLVDKGNLVKADDTQLVTINQTMPVNVTIAVPERYLTEIKKQMARSPIVVEAAPSQETRAASRGTVTFIDNAVDHLTGTIKVKGTFPNGDRRLWPGQFVDTFVRLSTIKDAVVVPSSAVQMGQNGHYVYVVKNDGTAELRNVAAGVAHEGMTAIESGVSSGEKIVTDGQLRITPGVKVEEKTDNSPNPAKK